MSRTQANLVNTWRMGGWQQHIAAVPPYVDTPISALYLPVLRQLVELAEIFTYDLNAARFLCTFEEKYFYFFAGEMHI